MIEREIPGAGKLSAQELQGISQKSCGVLNQMGPQIQWVESFVTPDKIYENRTFKNKSITRRSTRMRTTIIFSHSISFPLIASLFLL